MNGHFKKHTIILAVFCVLALTSCSSVPDTMLPLYRKRFAEYKEALEQQENK